MPAGGPMIWEGDYSRPVRKEGPTNSGILLCDVYFA